VWVSTGCWTMCKSCGCFLEAVTHVANLSQPQRGGVRWSRSCVPLTSRRWRGGESTCKEDLVQLEPLFDCTGQVAVVIGGSGVLCGGLARALGRCGATVVVVGHAHMDKASRVAKQIVAEGGQAVALQADVLDKYSLEMLAQGTRSRFGRVDILINGAGGAKKEATTSDQLSFYDLPQDAVRWVFDLNLVSAFLACQVFGRIMAAQGSGCILNISSMGAERPLTRSVAYSAAKAAVSNFTRWLAAYMSQTYSPRIRVNALAPGFFLTEQNRFLLTDEKTGELTSRGMRILAHTPMGRFGVPEDLEGTVLWLVSRGASFVHGIVVPVDGGFSAYSGV
jgi:NAD(P)-dependent dehydrogenase (short-subunit alcohol dehydrogenase family)